MLKATVNLISPFQAPMPVADGLSPYDINWDNENGTVVIDQAYATGINGINGLTFHPKP